MAGHFLAGDFLGGYREGYLIFILYILSNISGLAICTVLARMSVVKVMVCLKGKNVKPYCFLAYKRYIKRMRTLRVLSIYLIYLML